MKAQDVKIGMEVLMNGVRSNLNGRHRQHGTVTYVHEMHRSATVVIPNGTVYHIGTTDLQPLVRALRETLAGNNAAD